MKNILQVSAVIALALAGNSVFAQTPVAGSKQHGGGDVSGKNPAGTPAAPAPTNNGQAGTPGNAPDTGTARNGMPGNSKSPDASPAKTRQREQNSIGDKTESGLPVEPSHDGR